MPYSHQEERKSRIQLSWNTYLDLEEQVIDFLSFVPLIESHLSLLSETSNYYLASWTRGYKPFNLLIGNVKIRSNDYF